MVLRSVCYIFYRYEHLSDWVFPALNERNLKQIKCASRAGAFGFVGRCYG